MRQSCCVALICFLGTESKHDDTKRLLVELSRDNGAFVEESIRKHAGDLFGTTTMSSLLARSLYDLVIMASPHGTPQESLYIGVNKLLEIAKVVALVALLVDLSVLALTDLFHRNNFRPT